MNVAGHLGALREREFRLFFIGQSLSLLGDGMVPLALAFAVLDLTGSVSDLGFVLAARTAPLVAFILVGGVFADRLSRRGVMVTADLVRFVSQGLLAALVITGNAEIWHFLVLLTISGTGMAFFGPALTGLTPAIVSAERLQQANALRGISTAAGETAGPAIAGALVVTVGAGWALAVDAATFAVSAAFLALLRVPKHERLQSQPFVRDLIEGWREFRSRTWLWVIVLEAAFANFLAAPFFVLGAAIAKESLGGAPAWALILATFNGGALAGGLLALRIRPRRPLIAAFAAFVFFGVPSILLALELPAGAIAAGAFFAGGGLTLGNALWETTLQQQVPAPVLSRVTAYDWFGSISLHAVGFALVGPVSGAIGMTTTLWIAGLSIVVSSLAVVAVRPVRAIESPPREPPEFPSRPAIGTKMP